MKVSGPSWRKLLPDQNVEQVALSPQYTGLKFRLKHHNSARLDVARCPGGWVLRVNKSLRDVSAKETMKSSEESGNSGSDEARKAVQENLSDAGPARDAYQDVHQDFHQDVHQDSHHRDSHHRDVQDHTELPCLFHSYLAGCANGQHCRFSHSIHADQVRAPSAQTRRGVARNRIKKRVTKHLDSANLYAVQEILQREAERDSFAKDLISIWAIWELISVTNQKPLEDYSRGSVMVYHGMGHLTYVD